jgi:DNA primase
MWLDFKSLREQLTDETIKNILLQFNVEPVNENEDVIIFPTCCHNIEGGSPKLYYYKNNKLFHCYTECNETFDIFELLKKMYTLRNKEISLYDAVSLCGLDIGGSIKGIEVDADNMKLLREMQVINNTHIITDEDLQFKTYNKDILRHFSFDYVGELSWIEEGISVEALQRFNIKYDNKANAILIPNFNIDGDLIGVRARYFNPSDVQKGKYRPVFWNGTLYNHPTGRTFYGIYENHTNIEKQHLVVIFEGEKSVLKYGTIYGNDNNVSLATLGQNITRDHIELLRRMNVRTVILAYDTDYEDAKELEEVEKKYQAKARILAPYFNVYYLMDYDFLLPYKSSPIDNGKEIFETLLKNRKGLTR